MYESFIFYASFHEATKELSMEQYGKIMYVLNEYALNGIVPEHFEDPIVKMAFTFMKPQIDANNQRKDNGKYGAMGGRPKNHTTKKENPTTENKNPMGFENTEIENPMGFENDENKNPNVNVNENVNVNVNDIVCTADTGTANDTPSEPISKPKTEKPKKPPLREREPDNDIEAIEKAYLEEWDGLVRDGILQTASPPSGQWTVARALIKQNLNSGFSVDQLIKAVHDGARDHFVLQSGYSLKSMMGSGVINRLVNGHDMIPNKINGREILENDRIAMESMAKFDEQNAKNLARFKNETITVPQYDTVRSEVNADSMW